MTIKRFGLLVLLVVILVACGDPHDKLLPQDITTADQSTKDAIAKLSDDDKQLLVAYEVRHTLAGMADKSAGVPPGMTIGNAINEQRQWALDQAKREAEAAAIKAQLKKVHDDAVAKLRAAVKGTLLQVKFVPSDFEVHRIEDQISIKIAFTNTSGKPISGIKGVAIFTDMFGDVIMRSGLTTDDTIQDGKTLEWDGSIRYNQFEKSHVALRTADPDKIKFDFEPSMVVFTDGTNLKAPDADD